MELDQDMLYTLYVKELLFISFFRLIMYLQIVMEYCGGGSVADLMNITDEPLEENQIAYICKEALKVTSSSFGLTIQVILAN